MHALQGGDVSLEERGNVLVRDLERRNGTTSVPRQCLKVTQYLVLLRYENTINRAMNGTPTAAY